MFLAASIAVVIAMALALVRALLGPTVYDRILAVNMFGTKTVLLLALLGYVTGRPEFADISLSYALINFVGVVGIMRFFRFQDRRDAATPSHAAAGANGGAGDA